MVHVLNGFKSKNKSRLLMSVDEFNQNVILKQAPYNEGIYSVRLAEVIDYKLYERIFLCEVYATSFDTQMHKIWIKLSSYKFPKPYIEHLGIKSFRS